MKATPEIEARITPKSDSELMEMLRKPDDWRPEMVDAAKAELQSRGVDVASIVPTASQQKQADACQSAPQIPPTEPSKGNPPKMPKALWFIVGPGLALLLWATIHAVFFEQHKPQRLTEPSYSNLKRELEVEGVKVHDIRSKIGGGIEGFFHGNQAVGSTWIYLDIALNRPDMESAKAASNRVIARFRSYVKSGKLGFQVAYLDIQFSSPEFLIANIPVE